MNMITDAARILAQTDIDQLNARLETAERERNFINEIASARGDVIYKSRQLLGLPRDTGPSIEVGIAELTARAEQAEYELQGAQNALVKFGADSRVEHDALMARLAAAERERDMHKKDSEEQYLIWEKLELQYSQLVAQLATLTAQLDAALARAESAERGLLGAKHIWETENAALRAQVAALSEAANDIVEFTKAYDVGRSNLDNDVIIYSSKTDAVLTFGMLRTLRAALAQAPESEIGK